MVDSSISGEVGRYVPRQVQEQKPKSYSGKINREKARTARIKAGEKLIRTIGKIKQQEFKRAQTLQKQKEARIKKFLAAAKKPVQSRPIFKKEQRVTIRLR